MEFLVEEESAAEALKPLLAKIFKGERIRTAIRQFQGKPDLLKKLPQRLQGYAAARKRGEDIRVVVLVDLDMDDCIDLKRKLDAVAEKCGLVTRAKCGEEGGFHVLNRIAIRELESWYFGDWAAVRSAFPKVTQDVPRAYKVNPDLVSGKCSDAFEKILRMNGVRISSKPEWGRRIGPRLSLEGNKSQSFNAFVSGVREIGRTP
ncbi:DUF4276 family protein [Streptomyces sp. NBC_00341]|uniref:DUF4276 family protein n=1 Tax=Streptomyces sp. NBC_00341 TaxID=2975717 RepID=UPI00308F711A|nr:DUF4276 family protein [Streptomyces sp. NBC_00341]